ncbi:hypothetical protein B0H19DRAFT_1060707 [Mycena capillaripes]|nr:hypothetical protein B0H19DRAFT_1060707 [Mycena capillaripes]
MAISDRCDGLARAIHHFLPVASRRFPPSTLAYLWKHNPRRSWAFIKNTGGPLRRWYSDTSPQQKKQWTASVITANTADTTPTIALSFENSPGFYVFNVGENTRRAFTTRANAHQRAQCLNLFVTQTILQRVAGLGGNLIFSFLSMINDPERKFDTLNVVGPPGLSHYIASMRFHVSRDSVRATVTQSSLAADMTPAPKPYFQDDNIRVYSIPILPHTDTPHAETDIVSLNKAREWRKRVLRSMFTEARAEERNHDQLPKLHEKYTQIWRSTMAYVVIDSPTRTESPAVVIILDVPSPSYIPSLLDSFNRSQFYSKIQSESSEYTVRSIFHLCGEGVLEDERYVGFMNKFPADTNHVISSPKTDCNPLSFQAVALQQSKLNCLDPVVFPIPQCSLDPEKALNEQGLQIGIRPATRPATAVEDPSAWASQDANLSPSVLHAFNELKDRVSTREYGQEVILRRRTGWKRDSAEYDKLKRLNNTSIIPLGTSGGGANPYLPSTLIRIPGWGSILLDCGEGTWGQLARQFGTPGACDVLRDLRCIFVSQMHIDNHGGLASLLAMRQKLDPPAGPLYLVADYKIQLYLREVSDIENLGIDDPSGNGVVSIISEMIYVAPRNFAERGDWAEPVRSWRARQDLCQVLGLLTFETIWGEDRNKSSGVVFRHTDGWSIVYSGRTIPDRVLLHAGKDATLLIHDGSRAEDEQELDEEKARVMVDEALDIGSRMNVQHLLLTHFSGRYPRTPPWAKVMILRKKNDKPTVSYAFDHANLTLGSLWKMKLYLPVMVQIFREDGDQTAFGLKRQDLAASNTRPKVLRRL